MRFVRALGDPPEALDIDALRDAISRDEVDLVLVFGSHAEGDADELSDLDVAVRFDPDVGAAGKRRLLDELTVSIQDATAYEAIDLVDLEAVGPELGYEVLSRGLLVYGDRDAAIDLEATFLLKSLDLQPVKRPWRDAFDDRIREGSFGRP